MACYKVNHTHQSRDHLTHSLVQLGELGDAESALSEANILNNRDPLTWAYLALLCMKVSV